MIMDKFPNKIGCHVSSAGGVIRAPKNAHEFGCEVFQTFTRPPQGGPAPKVDDGIATFFKDEMKKYNYDTFVIHAPYFINFGSETPRIYHGSVSIVRQELERGSILGAKYVMFHPGSLGKLQTRTKEEGIKKVKEGFVKILEDYTGTTQLLIENTAGAGEVVGDTFEELADLMEPLLKFKTFGGICFDTQHAFGSGYDLRTAKAVEETFKKFDKAVGLEYIKCFQINDSKVELGSHKDRHEHISDGLIGAQGFAALLEFLKAKHLDIPLILETEHDKVKEDIELLKKLRHKISQK
jgi:deoxyribonuclease IV